ncbi:MAG: heme o synthase [Gemmatimonadota bacterium]
MTTATQRAGSAAAARPVDGGGGRQLMRDYITLTKPRIISLLLVTTIVPMIVAQRGLPTPSLLIWTALGGYLMAGGANAINMFIDRDIDARMVRTALRPIPSGRLSPGHVLAFGLLLATVAFALFWYRVNAASALLAGTGLLFYVFVYTQWLKRRTPQNIVIGGVAGAFPPLVGWAAVTGSLAPTPLILFLIVILWTPPHFWALAIVKREEYGRAMIPMAPNVWGEERTLRQMLAYTIAVVLASLAPLALGDLGVVYGALAVVLGAWFLRDILVLRSASARAAPAWAAYRTSLLYLALLFVAMAVDVGLSGGG